MDARDVISRRAWSPTEQVIAARLISTIALAGLATAAALALWFCLRRASGALVSPLSSVQLLGCGVLLALAALGFRAPFFKSTAGRPGPRVWTLWSVVAAAGVLFAAALSLADSTVSGLVGLWGVLLLQEGWSWGRLWQSQITRTQESVHRVNEPVSMAVATAPGTTAVALKDERPISASSSSVRPAGELESFEQSEQPADFGADDESIVQQMTRRRTLEGGESLEGWLRVELAAGQRHATAHVAICPPLMDVPVCFADLVDGPSAQVKVAQVLSYGVRFEIRLDEATHEPQSVAIEFSIQPAGTEASPKSSDDE